MPFANLRPFDFGPAQRRGTLLGVLASGIAASFGLAASWLVSMRVPLPPAANPSSADLGDLLLDVSTLAWIMAATVVWIIIRGQRQQIALLTESRERKRAIVDNMVDGAIHIDDQGRLVALNSAAERIFHWSSAELRDKPLTTLLPLCSHGQMDGVLHDQITEPRNQDPSSRAHEVIGRRQDDGRYTDPDHRHGGLGHRQGPGCLSRRLHGRLHLQTVANEATGGRPDAVAATASGARGQDRRRPASVNRRQRQPMTTPSQAPDTTRLWSSNHLLK